MADLSTLIAKLEAATGPSRELDALIHAEATGKETIYDGGERPHSAVIVGEKSWANRDGSESVSIEGYAPNYTASIDAALTLVPDGWTWAVARRYGGKAPYFGDCASVQWIECFGGNREHGEAFGSSAPLSLVIAALRARLSMEANQ